MLALEVDCISRGKARNPYEFGVTVTLATALKEGLLAGMRSMPGNPYDGHTLDANIEQVSILTKHRPGTVRATRARKSTVCRSSEQNGTEQVRSAARRDAYDEGLDQATQCH